MLNSFRKPALVPAVRRWDSMFDSVMSKLDLLPGEDLHSDLDDYIHPDIEISDSAVVARMAIPGYTKKDITVEIENDMLNVRAEHSECANGHCKGKKLLRGERIHTEFCRSIRLPGDIKSSEASAVCADGVLIVTVPRENANAALSRKIEVK